MSCSLEYHISVRHSIPASFALLGLLALTPIFVATSQAQINGTPASVTSPGFGGRAINGTPPSVTSLGPRGLVPNSRVTFNTFNGTHVGDGHRHHHRTEFTPPPVVYAVPVPYAVDAPYDVEDSSADEPDANYQGGPTIFDRRGSGAASYIPPVTNSPRPRPAAQEAEADADVSVPDPDPPQEPTLLVFKDGRKLELGNYAIIGATLFDLTPGHARRVALADLDLEATRKQNDERGVTFQLPPRSQAN